MSAEQKQKKRQNISFVEKKITKQKHRKSQTRVRLRVNKWPKKQRGFDESPTKQVAGKKNKYT